MSFAIGLRGMRSGKAYPLDAGVKGRPLEEPVEMVLDLARLQAEQPGLEWYRPEEQSLWRFGSLLPLDPADPADRACIVTLREGATPLLDFSDHPVAKKGGFRLKIKEEGRAYPGHGRNPTQSFKDRGLMMTVSMARQHGLTKLAIPTQGNAGDALAEYALAAGLEAAIVMPRDTPMPILGRVAALAKLHRGLHLDVVEGTIREAGKRVREQYEPAGYFNVATLREPGWRIEGKKTMGLELAEPSTPGDSWRVPDVVVYPTGGGTGILGMWKAFDELEALGLIDGRRPRMVCVQSAATAPLVQAFEAGADEVAPVEPGRTMAVGLNVAGGAGHFRVLKIVRASGGCILAVAEEEIAAALRDVYLDKGCWVCPEGAACLAALGPLVAREVIRPGDHVVVFNTASMEKYLPLVRWLLVA